MPIVLCKLSEKRKQALTQRCNKLWWRNEKMNMSFWVTWQLHYRVNNCRFEFRHLPDRVNNRRFEFRQLPDRVNNCTFEFRQLPDRVNHCKFNFRQLPVRVNHCKFKFRQLTDRVNKYRFEFPTDNWVTSCATSGWMKHTNDISRRKASWAAFGKLLREQY